MSHPRRRSQAVGVPLVESLDGGRHELRLDPKQPRQSLGEDGEGAMGGGTRGVGVRAHATSKGVAGGRRGERASDVRGGAVAAADEPQSRLHGGGVGIGRVRGSRPRADVGGDGGRDEVELAGVDPHAIGDRLGLDPLGEVEGALDEEKLAVVVPDARGEGGERAGQLDEQPDDEPLILHVVAERGGAGEVRGEAARAPGGARRPRAERDRAARCTRRGEARGATCRQRGTPPAPRRRKPRRRCRGANREGRRRAGTARGRARRSRFRRETSRGRRETTSRPPPERRAPEDARVPRRGAVARDDDSRARGDPPSRKSVRSRRAFLHPSISDGSKLASVRAGVG